MTIAPLIVQQLVHGYRDGHRLLVSSTDLTSADQRAAREMSDLPGSTLRSSFAPYLTRYALPSGRWLAYAKTWQADDLPRSGCVWTHTLLVEQSHWSGHDEWQNISHLFRRPGPAADSTGSDYSPYAASVVVVDRGGEPHGVSDLAKRCIAAVYSNPGVGIATASETESIWIEALSVVVRSLPRDLAVLYSYVVGAPGSRPYSSGPLEFQVLQAKDDYRVRATGIRSFQECVESDSDTEWVDVVLGEAGPTAARSFALASSRTRALDPRTTFALLIAAKASAASAPRSPVDTATRIIGDIARRWPSKADGSELKDGLLGWIRSGSGLGRLPSTALLEAIIFTPDGDSFTRLDENIRSIVAQILKRDVDWGTHYASRFVKVPVGRIEREVLLNVAESWLESETIPEQARGIGLSVREFLIGRVPSLSLQPSTWRVWSDTTQELYAAALRSLPSVLLDEFVSTGLRSANQTLVQRVVQDYPSLVALDLGLQVEGDNDDDDEVLTAQLADDLTFEVRRELLKYGAPWTTTTAKLNWLARVARRDGLESARQIDWLRKLEIGELAGLQSSPSIAVLAFARFLARPQDAHVEKVLALISQYARFIDEGRLDALDITLSESLIGQALPSSRARAVRALVTVSYDALTSLPWSFSALSTVLQDGDFSSSLLSHFAKPRESRGSKRRGS